MLDRESLRDVCAGCGWTPDEFRHFYMKGAGSALRQLNAAVAASDAREVARIAHGWAGSTATAGVVGLVPVLRRVEEAAAGGRLDADALREIPALLERVRAELDGWCGAADPAGGLSRPRDGTSPS